MRPIRYENGFLMLLDQTKLPTQTEWVTCKDATAVATSIRDMVVRGAPAIGISAAYGAAIAAREASHLKWPEFLRKVDADLNILAASRPTAVNLFWALDRMRGFLEKAALQTSPPDPTSVAGIMEEEAIRMEEEDIRVNHAIGACGNALVRDGARILTHCNAGALATADYGTALGVIRAAHTAGKRIHVYADETRPWLQGARLTTWELMQDKIPVTLLCDSMAGWLMANRQVDMVITGADRIASNGDTANKIGTYALAVLAQYHHIPFYVAAPLSTIDMNLPDGTGIPIEERNGREITEYKGIALAPAGVSTYNPAFDVTPASLITALITERGLVRAPWKKRINELFLPDHLDRYQT